MTDTLVAEAPAELRQPEVVTLETVRTVSRGRSLGFGIAVIVFGLIEVLFLGLRTSPQDTESTIQFAYSSAEAVPALSTFASVVVGVVGFAVLVGSILLIVRRRLKPLAWLGAVVGLLLIAWPVSLALGINVDGELRSLTLPVTGVAYVVGGLTLAAGIALTVARSARWAYPALFGATGLFVLTYLIWIARGSGSGAFGAFPLTLTAILSSTFISATPLIYGSLSGAMCERSGVVNIAIEGQFMLGAMGAAMVTSLIGATTLGFAMGTLAAAVLGAGLGLVLAWFALYFRANQILVGVLIVAFCTAFVQFMMSQVLDVRQWLNQGYGTLPIAIPGLSKIPVIGPVLFDQTYFVYLALVLVGLVSWVLFRTKYGLRWRSVGEKPRASETVGINVVRTRYLAVILGGAVAGLGGAVFTIGSGVQMDVGLTANEGFIALAIMILGRWRPWYALAATLLFGFSIALDATLSVYTSTAFLPSQFIEALPYLVTIAAVAGLVGRVRPPAADGIPYARE